MKRHKLPHSRRDYPIAKRSVADQTELPVSSESDAWPVYRLRELLLESPKYGANAPAAPYDKNLPRYIRITDITADGQLLDGDPRSIPWEAAAGSLLERDDILFARSGATVGKAYIHNKDETCAHAGYLIKVRVNPRKLRPEFLFQITQSPFYAAWLMSVVHAGAQPNVNAEEFGQLPISLPPLPEQRRIAAILGTWDAAIEKAERSLAATRAIRNVELARAISKQNMGNLVTLGHLVEVVTSKVTDQGSPILTISAENGFVEQQTYFARRIASESLHTYSMLERGEFAYNRSRANGYPYGAIKRLNTLDRGAVTSLYLCFRSKSKDQAIGDYLEVLFDTGVLNSQLARVAKEGSRAHGLLSVGKEDFLSMTVCMPPERTRITVAALHQHALAEIAASAKRVQLLREQKSGLMQKLLTGKIRVREAVADLSPAAD